MKGLYTAARKNFFPLSSSGINFISARYLFQSFNSFEEKDSSSFSESRQFSVQQTTQTNTQQKPKDLTYSITIFARARAC